MVVISDEKNALIGSLAGYPQAQTPTTTANSSLSLSLLLTMDRLQLVMIALPLFLFCTDMINLFTPPPPPKPSHHHHHHHGHLHKPHHEPVAPQTFDFPTQLGSGIGGGSAYGSTVEIKFCSSCSYKGNAMTMKKMLESSFPGIDVLLANYPPTLPKRVLAKLVPVFQFGVIGIVMGGEQIFPRLGYMTPPSWYFSMRQNRFGTIASAWLLGNVMQSFLQSSGAFEVLCNGELVFSKLKEQRFPSEFELKELVNKKLAGRSVLKNLGAGEVWA